MLEWLKRHAWKACNHQKWFPSSNLGHSAKKKIDYQSFNVTTPNLLPVIGIKLGAFL